ncbi:hypothetical protein WPS_28790 [Vulcanimicrobium alpinum]|uniref:DUF5069 domain-containing protein n=1 Tax=Vulcanimicrobium alpinum TaxID=3016050 RepID=A0AAN2CB53_UNVUL|nr:DUF5069 domain-containing protein [Vulcanimicrobium alpinum]BDE07603.1 hypothetical protein WPS_28790 [Vulcanimicrobium alpinum]
MRNLCGAAAVKALAMLQKDLTTSYPRSVREKLHGVVQVGRAIDKGIATANGTNGEYHYNCPMDKAVFGLLGVDHEALMDVIKKANSVGEIEAYVKPFVDKTSPAEIEQFNAHFLEAGPEPGSESHAYFLELRNQVAPDRTDVTAWPDLLDLDEKRPVPQRVAS